MYSPHSLLNQWALRALPVLLLSISASPVGANWRVVPSIAVGSEIDDNASLFADSDNAVEADGYGVDTEAAFNYESQVSNFSMTPRVHLMRFNESELDYENFFLNTSYRYTGQRTAFNFWGVYGDESVRTAERANVDLDVSDPEQIPDDNSGNVLATKNRQRLQLRPTFSFDPGRRSTILIGANFIDVTYDSEVGQNLTDYDQISLDAAANIRVSQRGTFVISAYARENTFARLPDAEFNGVGGTIGFTRRISERTRFTFNVGGDSTEDLAGEDQTSTVGNISLIHNTETSQVLASYRRNVSGNGAGQLSVRDSINLNFTRRITPKVSIGAGASAYSSESLDDNAQTNQDQDYLQLRGLLTWNITPVLSFDFDYRFTSLDRAIDDSSGDSNRFNLWFRYRRLP